MGIGLGDLEGVPRWLAIIAVIVLCSVMIIGAIPTLIDILDWGSSGGGEGTLAAREAVISATETAWVTYINTQNLITPKKGNFAISIPDQDTTQVGVSFEQGTIALPPIPYDLVFENCHYYVDSPSFVQCLFVFPISAFGVGNAPLEEIVGNQSTDKVSLNSPSPQVIEIGKSYMVTTYSGSFAAFRITSVEKISPPSFTIEWVYRPNN